MKDDRIIYARDEIYRMLLAALIKKKPRPPAGWSVAAFGREVSESGTAYHPDLFVRHFEAFSVSVFYLVDFASGMPDRVNLSASNELVREICGDLADEIERITYYPEQVIAEHRGLKSWLKAILAARTCLIYRAETARVIAEQERRKKTKQPVTEAKASDQAGKTGKWPSKLARSIFEKVSGGQNASAQPGLFGDFNSEK